MHEASLENREYGCRDPSRWPHGTLYPEKLTLISPTSGQYSLLVDSDHGVYLKKIAWSKSYFHACIMIF
jgi:hypothetical protein